MKAPAQPGGFRRFAFNLRPQHLETLAGFSTRILSRNHEGPEHQRYLTRITQTDRDIPEESVWREILEARTGRNLTHLAGKDDHFVAHDGSRCDECATTIGGRLRCTLCAYGAVVEQAAHFDSFVCVRHARWTGPDTTASQQEGVDEDIVRTELRRQKLIRSRLVDAAKYLAVFNLISSERERRITPGQAHRTHFQHTIAILDVLSSTSFQQVFFDPRRTYRASYELLLRELTRVLGPDAPDIAKRIWMRYRPTFLSIRERLLGEPTVPETNHQLPVATAMLQAPPATTYPFEPFRKYLEASETTTVTRDNWRELLAPTAAPTDGTFTLVDTICLKGHRTSRTVQSLNKWTRLNRDPCGVCNHRIIRAGCNDFATTHPQIAASFHPTKNGTATAADFFAFVSTKKFHWLCTCGNTWEATPSNRCALGSGCPACSNSIIVPGNNDLLTRCPAAGDLWDQTRNRDDITTVSPRARTAVWWLCEEGHHYKEPVADFVDRGRCRTCTQEDVTATKSVATRPDLARQWHPTRNGTVSASDKTLGSAFLAYWICEHGHTDRLAIWKKTAGYGCRVCSNRTLTRGINDAATRHPDICAEWHPFANGAKRARDVLPGTTTYWWKCKAAGHNLLQSIPHRVLSGGCPDCPKEGRISAPPKGQDEEA